MNTFDTREQERTDYSPQKPHRAPWPVICSLAATLAFVAGHMLWQAQPQTTLQTPAPAPSAVLAPKGTKGLYPFVRLSQNPVADVVASVEPSVVSIDTTIKEKDTSGLSLGDLLSPKHGHSILKTPEKFEAHGSGSGVIIRPDGYILTNAHVIKDATNIKVTLNDNRIYTGRVIGRDAYTDVALVKIDAGGLPVAKLGDSKAVRPGDWAIAIGTPLGLSHTVTMGIVSAVGRSLADLNNNVDLIQTDAAINPGNSGGPLLNIQGEVIGLNMAIRTDAQNIGFSVPINIARDAANSILEHKPIMHPYLGISMVDFDSDLAQTVGLPSTLQGVLVSKVNNDSPAALSGLSEGDLIERVDGTPVKTGTDVQKIVRAHKVGTTLDIDLMRGGKDKNVAVTLEPYPDDKDG